MNLLTAILAAAQVVVPSGDGLSLDQRVALLAESASRTKARIERAVYDSPDLRAEIRRVGLARGCVAVDLAGNEVRERHQEALRIALGGAIRTAIPAQRLAEARPLSFVVGPLSPYVGRVESELERSSAPLLADLAENMRRAFVERTSLIPTTTSEADNRIAPRPDIAAALGIGDYWDLDNPNQLAMACIEQRIPQHLRPTITTEPSRQ